MGIGYDSMYIFWSKGLFPGIFLHQLGAGVLVTGFLRPGAVNSYGFPSYCRPHPNSIISLSVIMLSPHPLSSPLLLRKELFTTYKFISSFPYLWQNWSDRPAQSIFFVRHQMLNALGKSMMALVSVAKYHRWWKIKSRKMSVKLEFRVSFSTLDLPERVERQWKGD